MLHLETSEAVPNVKYLSVVKITIFFQTLRWIHILEYKFGGERILVYCIFRAQIHKI